MKQRRRTVTLRLPLGIQVDRDIAPFVQACWRRGLRVRFAEAGDARDPGDGILMHGWKYQEAAALQFASPLEAAIFAAVAGPFAWTDRDDRLRRVERPAGVDRVRWDWQLLGDVVRFPHRDIVRAKRAVDRCGWTLPQLVAAAQIPSPPKRAGATRTCQTCGEAIPPWRRRDAIYCSRRCQLGARVRGKPRTIERATSDPTLRARFRCPEPRQKS